ncbi:MAG: glycosyltransferase [Pseudomonadota bacterium]
MTNADALSHGALGPILDRSFETLVEEDYVPLFDRAREMTSDTGEVENRTLPRHIFQYWNANPDAQVTQLLETTKRLAEGNGVSYALFSEETATDYLRDRLGPRYVAAFQKCVHQAQKSAFFRYCYLLIHGGMWLDADLALRQSPAPLFAQPMPFFHQRRRIHSLLTNWLMIAASGDSVIDEIVAISLRNIEDTAFFERHAAARNIPAISGFHVVRRVAAQRLYSVFKNTSDAPTPIGVIDETVHDAFIGWAKLIIGEHLTYKTTNKAWQEWQKDGSD